MQIFDLTPGVPRDFEDDGFPAGPFSARERDEPAPSIGRGSWPPPGFIGLPAPISEHRRLMHLGATIAGARLMVPRKQITRPEFQTYAPLCARQRYLPLMPELIPENSWGASLHNLLTPRAWDSIRGPVKKQSGYVCQACGEENGRVEVHEIWRYECDEDSDWSVQHLEGLLCLCPACHLAFHPGFARVTGRADEARSRLMTTNGWSNREMNVASEWMTSLGLARSEKSWALDLSIIPQLAPEFAESPLPLRGEWHMADGGILTAQMRYQAEPTRTRIFGVAITLHGQTHEPVSSRDTERDLGAPLPRLAS